MSDWPITFEDVLDARERLRPYLQPTALRRYAALDALVGIGIEVWVKHENHQPTNAFKARNALAVLTALSAEQRARGVVAATRGNHGQALAWAGRLLGVGVTICVPRGNNPEKNEAMRGFGAELLEHGRDYDEALELAHRLVAERGSVMAHSTNDRQVIAGAGTLTLEVVEALDQVEALVVAVGGGSQAVGALTVCRARRPGLQVFGVQAAGASAIHDAWHAGEALTRRSAETIADGLATRQTYEMTFPALRAGLADFITVSDAQLAEAVRLLLRTTHNLAEPAGAAGLAGLLQLRRRLQGKRVALVLSGSNIDQQTLRRVLDREI
jgi:threonine dehydratase